MTRRELLQRGIWGGVLLTLGGSGLLALRRGAPAVLPPEGLKALNASQFSVLSSIAEALIPAVPGMPSVHDIPVAARVDGLISRMDPTVARELKQLLGLFDSALAGFLLGGRTAPFSRLSLEDRSRVLSDWQGSRLVLLRSGFSALRGLVMAAFYSAPASWPASGYPGPPTGFDNAGLSPWRGVGPRPAGNGSFH